MGNAESRGVPSSATLPVSEGIPFIQTSSEPTSVKPGAPGMELRSSSSFKEHMVTILPKGTILFRGVHTMEQLKNNFMGVRKSPETHTWCIPPTYTVYFYPFPFADVIIDDYQYCAIYVTTKDIPLVCLISPSTMTRGDRKNKGNPIVTCSKIPTDSDHSCGLKGRDYDACLNPEYMKVFPDVTGTIAIAVQDRTGFNRYFDDNPTSDLVTSLGTSVFRYQDKNDTGAFGYNDGGIPEIVLHPFSKSLKSDYRHESPNYYDYLKTHKEHLNYQPFSIILRSGLKSVIDHVQKDGVLYTHFDTKEGAHHVKRNPSTGFFQIVELSDPASFDTSQPFRFVYAPPPSRA